MVNRIVIISIALLLTPKFISTAFANQDSPIKAIRFDPGYYYDHPDSANVLALSEQLCEAWANNGVNTIYYMAYSSDGGARYRSKWPHNRMEDFGWKDLLGAMINSAHARDMKVVAWFFDRQHKHAWNRHADWRVKDQAGRDYKERPEDYFLSPFVPEATKWWNGMIEEFLSNYDQIDGIDIAEPLLNWWGTNTDFNPAAIERFNREHPGNRLSGYRWNTFRAKGLTDHLNRTTSLVHKYGKQVHITIIMTADRTGNLLSNQEQMIHTGFDLNGILDSEDPPDFINAELIWQQWKGEHGSRYFTPEWTRKATVQAFQNVAERSDLIVHIEASTFDGVSPEPGDLKSALLASQLSGAIHFDCYDANLLDQMNRWSEIAALYLKKGPVRLATLQ